MAADFVPSVALALDDFIPVALAGAASLAIAVTVTRAVPRMKAVAYGGALLILLGGLAKATWKLILAAGGPDLEWLETLLFVLLAPGFALLSTAVLAAYLRRSVSWLLPIGATAVAGAAAAVLTSVGPLMVLAIVCATALGLLAIALALRLHDRAAAALFALQIISAFALVPFAAPPQTEPKQWAEQSINTIGQLVFLLGALRLVRTRTPDSSPALQEALA